jgi:hypothetical protein
MASFPFGRGGRFVYLRCVADVVVAICWNHAAGIRVSSCRYGGTRPLFPRADSAVKVLRSVDKDIFTYATWGVWAILGRFVCGAFSSLELISKSGGFFPPPSLSDWSDSLQKSTSGKVPH